MSSNPSITSTLNTCQDHLHALCYHRLRCEGYRALNLGGDTVVTDEPLDGLFRCLSELHFFIFASDASGSSLPMRKFHATLLVPKDPADVGRVTFAETAAAALAAAPPPPNISVFMSLQVIGSSKAFFIKQYDRHTNSFSLSTTLLGQELSNQEIKNLIDLGKSLTFICNVTHRIHAHHMRDIVRSALCSPEMFCEHVILAIDPPLPDHSRRPEDDVLATEKYLILEDVLQSLHILTHASPSPRILSNYLYPQMCQRLGNLNVSDADHEISHPFIDSMFNTAIRRRTRQQALLPGAKVVFTRTVSPLIQLGVPYDVHSVAEKNCNTSLAFCVSLFQHKRLNALDPDQYTMTQQKNASKVILHDFARNFNTGMPVRFAQDFPFTRPPIYADRLYHLKDVNAAAGCFSVRFAYTFYHKTKDVSPFYKGDRDIRISGAVPVFVGCSILGQGLPINTVVRKVARDGVRQRVALSCPANAPKSGYTDYRVSYPFFNSRADDFSYGVTKITLSPIHPLDLTGCYIEGPGIAPDTKIDASSNDTTENKTELTLSLATNNYMEDLIDFNPPVFSIHIPCVKLERVSGRRADLADTHGWRDCSGLMGFSLIGPGIPKGTTVIQVEKVNGTLRRLVLSKEVKVTDSPLAETSTHTLFVGMQPFEYKMRSYKIGEQSIILESSYENLERVLTECCRGGAGGPGGAGGGAGGGGAGGGAGGGDDTLPPLLDGDAIYWPRELTESDIADLQSDEREKKRSAQNKIIEKCEEMSRHENFEAVSKIQHELIFEGYHKTSAFQLKECLHKLEKLLDKHQYNDELLSLLKLISSLQLQTNGHHHDERMKFRDILARMHMAEANEEILIEIATSALPSEALRLQTRLEAIVTFSRLAIVNWKMQLKAMKRGLFVVVFELLKSSDRHTVDMIIIPVLANLVHFNFRLQKWLHEKCIHENMPELFGSVWKRLGSTKTFEAHIKEFDDQLSELDKKFEKNSSKPRATGGGDHGPDEFSGDTITLAGRKQVGGTCYAYACARSFIHR
jgi:hypothetical protein